MYDYLTNPNNLNCSEIGGGIKLCLFRDKRDDPDFVRFIEENANYDSENFAYHDFDTSKNINKKKGAWEISNSNEAVPYGQVKAKNLLNMRYDQARNDPDTIADYYIEPYRENNPQGCDNIETVE